MAKFLVNIDATGNEVQNFAIQNATSAPTAIATKEGGTTTTAPLVRRFSSITTAPLGRPSPLVPLELSSLMTLT
jgi:hypothetical protein